MDRGRGTTSGSFSLGLSPLLGRRCKLRPTASPRNRAHEEARQVLGAAASSAAGQDERDERPWYLNLHKSFSTLRDLRHQVEQVAIPQMTKRGSDHGRDRPDRALRRRPGSRVGKAAGGAHPLEEVYYRDFIPLATVSPCSAQVYNDRVRPADPTNSTDLLAGSGLLSVSRNATLEELAERVRQENRRTDGKALDCLSRPLRSGRGRRRPFGPESARALLRLLAQMAPPIKARSTRLPRLTRWSTGARSTSIAFRGEERRIQEELLDLARAATACATTITCIWTRFRRLVEAAQAEHQARLAGPPPM